MKLGLVNTQRALAPSPCIQGDDSVAATPASPSVPARQHRRRRRRSYQRGEFLEDRGKVSSALARIPVITLLLAVLTLAATAAPASIEYDRALILAAQCWRILTCHFAHFPGEHFGWCLAALLILGIGCELLERRGFIMTLLLSMVAIPLALLVLAPNLPRYRGLSGVESALFVLLLAQILWERFDERHWIGFAAAAALGIAFIAKILIEIRFGATVFVSGAMSGFEPVPLAHLVGCAAALISLAVVKLIPHR